MEPVNRFLKPSFFPANQRRDLKISKLKETNSDILKLKLGCDAWGNKTKEIILRLSNEQYISLVFSPTPRSQIWISYISKMVHWQQYLTQERKLECMEKGKTSRKKKNKRNYQEASCNRSTKLHVELFEVTTVLPCCGKYPPKLSTNIGSCIQNNTWSSEFFSLNRVGVRQGCPLSP